MDKKELLASLQEDGEIFSIAKGNATGNALNPNIRLESTYALDMFTNLAKRMDPDEFIYIGLKND